MLKVEQPVSGSRIQPEYQILLPGGPSTTLAIPCSSVDVITGPNPANPPRGNFPASFWRLQWARDDHNKQSGQDYPAFVGEEMSCRDVNCAAPAALCARHRAGSPGPGCFAYFVLMEAVKQSKKVQISPVIYNATSSSTRGYVISSTE